MAFMSCVTGQVTKTSLSWVLICLLQWAVEQIKMAGPKLSTGWVQRRAFLTRTQ